MKTFSLYQCEFCGRQYNNRMTCEAGEKNHRKPIAVEPWKYVAIGDDKTGLPVVVKVTMDDGGIAAYKRVK